MITVSTEMLHAAHHFMMREARLLDRHRFAYHFQAGPVAPIRASLEAYRNVDGGYGNGLDPDLRGHGSQPRSVKFALTVLDELGDIPRPTADHIATYLTSITRPDGGVPRVLPGARHTESAPWWRESEEFGGALSPTATIAGLLHKHHIAHRWRDRATAFVWSTIEDLRWIHPGDAIAVCDFLTHTPDQNRARTALTRLTPMIRAEIEFAPSAPGHLHKPLDLAPHPAHIAAGIFTDNEIAAHLDGLIGAQQEDGGWLSNKDTWCPAATAEWRGIFTVRRLRTLRDYGRLDGS